MTARLIMKMKVAAVTHEPNNVRVYTLSHPLRDTLADPHPGAHVDVRTAGGQIRQYSLCGDPDDLSVYKIAIKREDSGRGGSRWFHDNLEVGDTVLVTTPRNNFALNLEAGRHILIAGGIGITPFIAMARRLARRNAQFTLHYCAKSSNAPFLAELRKICGDRLVTHFSDVPESRFHPADVLMNAPSDAHVYFCGPQKLTDAVKEATADWPEERVHFEVFAPTLDENFNPEPFDIVIGSSGKIIRVPANKSALELLRAEGFAMPSSCELGVCGSCVCTYRDGIVIHRDSILKVSERQDKMLVCVSRARVRVTLDL
jgi:vanillate O-demethylase ferredoxin subunit